jgi:uncharacterized protein (TIGR03437 family)
VNQTPEISGYSVIYFQTAERDLNGWNNPPLSPRFDELLIASPERLYGLERSTHRLWQMDLANHAMSVSDVAGVYDAHNIVAAAISQERPSARFLYLLEDSAGLPKMKRVDALTNTLQVESPATSTSGLFQFAPIPPQSGASQFIKINDNQVLPGGGVALPIGAYILDSFGRPVFNQTVSFTSTDSNVSFATPAATTNSDGFVETGVGIPLVPGAYTITLSAQGATTNFSIVVPGGDGGVPGGSPLISIVRGDGQLLRENQTTSFFAPLTVLIVDEHGAPRAGVPVTFSLASGVGGLTTPNVITSDAGLASTLYRSPAISQQLAFQDIVVRATSEVGSVEFHEITHKIDGTGFGEPQYLNPLNPQFPTQWPSFITVGRGDLIPNFFTYQVKTRHPFLPAAPIPNVKLRFAQDADETLDGPGRCVNNTATDQNGVGHCDLKLSCDLEGDPYVRMMIGERIGVKMRLLVGPASSQSLTYVSGNNQAGIAGQTLPSALVAQIGDNCGGGLAGREVVWTVTQGAATLTQVATTSNAAGLVSARVVLGSTPGPVKVSVVMANADPIIFDLANNAVISGVQVVSGGAQTALTNQAFANPLVFVVRDNLNNPVGAGYNVVFTTTGSVVLDTNQATTDAQGRVQVLATAGPLAGPVTVRATHAGFSATAQLTVGTPPPPSLPLTPASFYNNASFNTPNKAEGMTPCGLVTVIGNGLASTVAGVVSGVGFGPMPYTLAGVSLTVNGVPAPLRAVSNVDGEQRVDFQAPCETAVGTATVVITVNGGTTTINGVKVFAGQPGIFSYKWSDNKNYGAVVRVKDGSYITPSNLAVTGEDYLMFVTGLGQTTPATATNSAGVGQSVALQVVVGVDDGGVPQQQARYVPGLIGVYSVQFTLPKRDGVPAGATILSRQGTQTINFALAVVVNGQVIFGNPLLLPGMIQGQ